MMFLRDVGLCALWAGIVTANQSCGSPDVHVDVAIIGGGSGGIHAAIQLKDAGASVLVVEKKDRIGGHAETYVNPETGVSANVGVVVFENRDIVHQYFDRLGVPYSVSIPNFGGGPSATYDFSTGVKVPPATPAQAQQQQKAVQDAVQAYSENVLSKYPWIDDGFLVPNPIPDELYMPFGELAHKYNFTALMPSMWSYNWYAGNITTLPSLYGIKNFGPGLLNSSATGFVRPKSGVTTSLYDAAAKDLGSSVLLSSTVHSVDRQSRSGGVTLVVSQPNKPPQKIYAKKLLVAIPPTLTNVGKYDLSKNEQNLFSKFNALAYFAGVCHVPGFNASLHNFGINTPFNQPIAPGNNGSLQHRRHHH
ncbi:hypothetical protein NQ176_g6628 [Zarea fungicola]|uniref:Uncharacterized protein n=1 Tax=Zarea fungicola TaxID=93591 RepID=A0ACC1N2W8_9HYPO|nr:hypothetical protein NQ176_g6628 [Lecanicillium fungicola]